MHRGYFRNSKSRFFLSLFCFIAHAMIILRYTLEGAIFWVDCTEKKFLPYSIWPWAFLSDSTFWIGFCQLIFYQNFSNFLEVKADINRVI